MGDCGYCDKGCTELMLGTSCYDVCNTEDCYFGLGICRECSTGCSASKLGDGNCDTSCNVKDCNYDFKDCASVTCAPNCYT